MRPGALVWLYRERLRMHLLSEFFAGLGVAVAVALVFALTVASENIQTSPARVSQALLEHPSLELDARSSDGFTQGLLAGVEHLADVRRAVPALEQSATIVGPNHREVGVEVLGTNSDLLPWGEVPAQAPARARSDDSVLLTTASASALGLPTGARNRASPTVSLEIRGRSNPVKVAILGSRTSGLSPARIALLPLGRLQGLAGLPGRITRILVETAPGTGAATRAALQRLVQGRIDVASNGRERALLDSTVPPGNQASGLFAAIGALLGFLLAFNAILPTLRARRRVIANLRVDGVRGSAIVQMVLFQALCLGISASLAGLFGGYALSLWVFHSSPAYVLEYLSEAFTVELASVIKTQPVLLASIDGILATCMASMVPLLDLRKGRALDAVYFEDPVADRALDLRGQGQMVAIVAGLTLLATALFLLSPSVSLIACVLLGFATVIATPLAFAASLRALNRLASRHSRLTILPPALASLRVAAPRSLALATAGAVAIFGGVALGGARADLLRELGVGAKLLSSEADIWALNPRDPLGVGSVTPADDASRIARVPGVAGVRVFQGQFLDVGNRRVWLIARPPLAGSELPAKASYRR